MSKKMPALSFLGKILKLVFVITFGLSISLFSENAWGYLSASCESSITATDARSNDDEFHLNRTYQAGTVLGISV